MSVDTLIKSPEIREALDRLVPSSLYRRVQAATARVPARSQVHGSVVGTAFDYAVRFELERRAPGTTAGRWVAEAVVDALASGQLTEGREHLVLLRKRIGNARIFHRKHITRRRPDDAWMLRLSRHALRLARIDPLWRAERGGDQALADDNAAAPEIVDMLKLVAFDRWAGQQPLLLNPTFGEAGTRVSGADCDVIAGNRLIELKTLKEATLERGTIRELTVYLMLADAARQAGEPFPKIEYVGVLFARHGHYWEMPTAPIFAHAEFARVRDLVMSPDPTPGGAR